jgi:LmbE family N-acetylglucosaminyl deacetylase
MSKRLLVCLAHPDDESFGSGSAIAKYVAEGVEVTLICATNGDVGMVSPEHMKGYETVAALRLAELNCAAQVLGFKEVVTFGYRDSGMMDTPDNQHPDSLWQAPLDKVAGQIVEVIRRVRPQVLLTFDPFGGYGHPDHIKIQQATLAAWRIVQGDAEHPQKLYYTALPRRLVKIGVVALRLLRKDPRHLGRNRDLDLQAVADAVLPAHAWIDTDRYYEIGRKASACHASQDFVGGAPSFLQLAARRFMRYSLFTRAEPPPKPGEPRESDLFAGVMA